MTIERAIRLARKWAEGGVCSLREGEAQEYHKMALAALRAQQAMEDAVANQHPCDGCGVGWGSANSNGVNKSCHDECQKLREWSQRRKEREGPKPLTLDELRKMDGEPVWVKADHYGVYADIIHIMGREDGESYVKFKINWRLQENGYGKTWLAYLRKPKEEV